MEPFKVILDRATKRKGGQQALDSLLPDVISEQTVRAKPDDYFLEEITRRIFQAGFVWRVINQKWPSFREAFFEFDLNRLMKLSEDDWNNYIHDRRIVRNRQKIQAVRHNLWFVNDIANRHSGFGSFLVEWPKTDLTGLFAFLKTKGSRLGGNTGQYFLQNVGVDSFALTGDVVSGLQLHGLDINTAPTSKKDLNLIQQTFNEWHVDTGLGYYHLSMILAFSVGENKIKADFPTT